MNRVNRKPPIVDGWCGQT